MSRSSPTSDDRRYSYLASLCDALPQHPEEHIHAQGSCDILHLLPEEKTVFHYSGSLTTPPCSEGVEWLMMQLPISLSKEQSGKFRHIYHGNNRPIREQAERLIGVVTN